MQKSEVRTFPDSDGVRARGALDDIETTVNIEQP
jgi:hypothetical protein